MVNPRNVRILKQINFLPEGKVVFFQRGVLAIQYSATKLSSSSRKSLAGKGATVRMETF